MIPEAAAAKAEKIKWPVVKFQTHDLMRGVPYHK